MIVLGAVGDVVERRSVVFRDLVRRAFVTGRLTLKIDLGHFAGAAAGSTRACSRSEGHGHDYKPQHRRMSRGLPSCSELPLAKSPSWSPPTGTAPEPCLLRAMNPRIARLRPSPAMPPPRRALLPDNFVSQGMLLGGLPRTQKRTTFRRVPVGTGPSREPIGCLVLSVCCAAVETTYQFEPRTSLAVVDLRPPGETPP
jgi:hypothetical protein